MTTIDKIISKDLKELIGLKPLTGEETRTFILVNAGVWDPGSERMISPQGRVMQGRDMIRDPGNTGGDILIRNIVRWNPITKPGEETKFDPIDEPVRFPNTGRVTVTASENNQYYYLLLNNGNRDNVNRKPGKTVKYYMQDEARDLKLRVDAFEFEILAGSILIELADSKNGELVDLVHALNKRNSKSKQMQFKVADKSVKEIYTDLTLFAKSNPISIIMASKNTYAQMRVLIENATTNRMIYFNQDDELQGTWFWYKATKGKEKICSVEIGNNPSKALADFLVSADGAKHKADLLNRHSEYADLQ